MDVSLNCSVCGAEYNAQDVEPHVNLGIMQQWRDTHQHSAGELKMYHDAGVAIHKDHHRAEGDDDAD